MKDPFNVIRYLNFAFDVKILIKTWLKYLQFNFIPFSHYIFSHSFSQHNIVILSMRGSLPIFLAFHNYRRALANSPPTTNTSKKHWYHY